MLKAIGKFIDTLPLRNLLSLEEINSDTVIIEVDRFHDDLDLSGFTFVMRGVTSSGKEMHSELNKKVSEDGNFLHLTWHIGSLFTAEEGTLFLDLVAYRYIREINPKNPPDYLLRYQLPSVEIRNIPKGLEEASDEKSYTAFWIDVKEQLSDLRIAVDTQGDMLRNLSTAVGSQSMQILELQDRIDILVMTQEEYDQLKEYDDHVLYVLT